MSKAAERSSKVSAVTLPLSMLSTISLCILRRAVSVEWNRLYGDCRSILNLKQVTTINMFMKAISNHFFQYF